MSSKQGIIQIRINKVYLLSQIYAWYSILKTMFFKTFQLDILQFKRSQQATLILIFRTIQLLFSRIEHLFLSALTHNINIDSNFSPGVLARFLTFYKPCIAHMIRRVRLETLEQEQCFKITYYQTNSLTIRKMMCKCIRNQPLNLYREHCK